MKKRILLVLMTVLAVTASVAAYYRVNNGPDTPQFTTAPATRGDVVETVEATGTLEAVTTVQVGSQVSGTIASLHADFNSQVKKGQVVARLEPSVLEAQVEQARASLERLQADVERARITVEDSEQKARRARELFEKGLIAAADNDTAAVTARQAQASLAAAKAQVTQAQASLNQAQVNLSHTVITAPVDGTVISRSVDVGQTVAASMSAPTLFQIARDLTEMQVNASIDEADIGRIAAGQPVTFRVDAYPNETFTGRVSQVRLNPVVAQNVVSYVTVIDVPNPELKLKPGMTATVTIEVARVDDAIKLPVAALRFRPTAEMLTPTQQADANGVPARDGQSRPQPAGGRRGSGNADASTARVWTLQDGALKPIRVRTGISDGMATAILEGDLAEGTAVITGVAAVTTAQAAPAASSPLIPQRPGGQRGQGRQGGGAR
jgi:HlyD family secretion protein